MSDVEIPAFPLDSTVSKQVFLGRLMGQVGSAQEHPKWDLER